LSFTVIPKLISTLLTGFPIDIGFKLLNTAIGPIKNKISKNSPQPPKKNL